MTGAIAVVLGGDASCATNGFWSALTIATTQKLPMLFYVEDNQYGISVPSSFQTPGGDIARNLASFTSLHVLSGDGTEPAEAARLIDEAVAHVRGGQGPALLRLTVPRLQGHSFQDTQTYKSERVRRVRMGARSVAQAQGAASASGVGRDRREARAAVAEARAEAEARGVSDPERVPTTSSTKARCSSAGGQWTQGYRAPHSPRRRGPKASGSTWSPRSAGRSTTSWRSTRASSCSARISGRRAASTR